MQDIKLSSRKMYRAVIQTFEKEFRQASSIPEEADIDPEKFVLWCIENASARPLSNAYRSLIRAALIHQYNNSEDGREAAMRAIYWRIAADETPAHWNADENGYSPRASRPSQRTIPREDWSLLINYFSSQKSILAMRAQMMLAAGVACGARPIEWIHAKIIAPQTIRIYTAKVKNINAWDRIKPGVFLEDESPQESDAAGNPSLGNSSPQEDRQVFEERLRDCDITDPELIQELRAHQNGSGNRIFRDVVFEPEYTLPVETHLRLIDGFFRQKFGDNWRQMGHDDLAHVFSRDYYAGVRITVWRACKKIFGPDKLYSPADTRSTFAANRRAKAGLRQTSLDMGHTSTTMTREHYAGPQKAWKTA